MPPKILIKIPFTFLSDKIILNAAETFSLEASKEKVSAAFKIILSDKNVKGILINIFGGIMRCDVLAQGVVDAAKEINIEVPLVVRLAGTNFKEGKEILDNSGLKLISAENLDDAAKKIVEAIK